MPERRAYGAAAGIVVAAFALSIGQAAAAFVATASAPVVAVAQASIDLTPEWLKSFAIRTFGESDKIVLVGGVLIVLVGLAAGVGTFAIRRRVVGDIAVLVLGAVGAAAAWTRPTSTPVWLVPSIVGAAAGLVALRLMVPTPSRSSAAPRIDPERPSRVLDRRTFVRTAFAIGGASVAAFATGSILSERRFAAEGSRSTVALPAPADGAPARGADVAFDVRGVTPFVTPNDAFYRVDTAVFPPQVRAEDWTLRIHGMVDREITLNLDDLLARDLVERYVTLSCVSNEVGGRYAGNARWLGALLRPLLEEAGIDAGATQLVSRSVDGMTIGTPTAVVMDGRDAMLAVGMNGEPLPVEHGFPVRMIVPGLYGYVSATKWVTEIQATTFEAFDPYWVERGWAQEPGTVKTMSRIDAPKPLASVRGGAVAVAGVAWAQHRGIERVEVRVDDGAWNTAELAGVPSVDTWRQWRWEWEAVPGRHTLQVRATDAAGETQPEEREQPFPSGATGWHSIVVVVA